MHLDSPLRVMARGEKLYGFRVQGPFLLENAMLIGERGVRVTDLENLWSELRLIGSFPLVGQTKRGMAWRIAQAERILRAIKIAEKSRLYSAAEHDRAWGKARKRVLWRVLTWDIRPALPEALNVPEILGSRHGPDILRNYLRPETRARIVRRVMVRFGVVGPERKVANG